MQRSTVVAARRGDRVGPRRPRWRDRCGAPGSRRLGARVMTALALAGRLVTSAGILDAGVLEVRPDGTIGYVGPASGWSRSGPRAGRHDRARVRRHPLSRWWGPHRHLARPGRGRRGRGAPPLPRHDHDAGQSGECVDPRARRRDRGDRLGRGHGVLDRRVPRRGTLPGPGAPGRTGPRPPAPARARRARDLAGGRRRRRRSSDGADGDARPGAARRRARRPSSSSGPGSSWDSATPARMPAAFGEALQALRRPLVTHLFNGMEPLHHRRPGPVAASLDALARGATHVELIADGVHLADETVHLVFAVDPGRHVVLVSDAMAAAGMPDGDFELGSMRVRVEERSGVDPHRAAVARGRHVARRRPGPPLRGERGRRSRRRGGGGHLHPGRPARPRRPRRPGYRPARRPRGARRRLAGPPGDARR